MQISSQVYLLASGSLGCSISHGNDCNVYALRCGSRFYLIDAGVGMETARIVQELGADGIEPAQVAGILLTHGHLDHSGGAAELHQALGAPVFASRETAHAVENGDEEAISLADAKRDGIYDLSFRLCPCPVRGALEDGQTWEVEDCQLTALRTPGHSGDMLTYLIRSPEGSLLFPGDTVFHGGAILPSPNWDCDPKAYAASLRKLAALPFDGMYPGHGIWSVQDGARHLQQSRRYLDRGVLPPSLL